MDRLFRLPFPAIVGAAAVLAGTLAIFLLEGPDEVSVRMRIQEQVAQRIRTELKTLEGLSFQFIANQDLNDSLYAYGNRANRYDVALYNLSFTRHLESQRVTATLLEDAFFLDYDEPERIPLTMTEDFLRPEIAEVRRFVWDRVVAADGAWAWIDRPLVVHGARYIAGARLIKRLKTGEPIGVLPILVSAERVALLLGESTDKRGAADGEFCALVASDGTALAVSAVPGAQGARGGDEALLRRAVEDKAEDSSRFIAETDGGRRSVVVARVAPEGPWLVSARPETADYGALARFLAAAAVAGAATAFGLRGSRALGAGRRAGSAVEGELPPDFPPLSPRERRLLVLLSRGLSNKEIAWEFGIKEQTVKNYLRSVYEKIGVHDRVSALLKLRGEAPGKRPEGST
jgi:DNA-binding CsgD family transcriptional regulator